MAPGDAHSFVSVVMPVRNEARLIRASVDAVLGQDPQHAEVRRGRLDQPRRARFAQKRIGVRPQDTARPQRIQQGLVEQNVAQVEATPGLEKAMISWSVISRAWFRAVSAAPREMPTGPARRPIPVDR
jgi:hypothetical protein